MISRYFAAALLPLLLAATTTSAFVAPSTTSHKQTHEHAHAHSTATALFSATNDDRLEQGDPVLLIGPGFQQLVLAKHLARAGLKPIVVASQTKLDSFFKSFLKTGDNEDHMGDEDPEGIHQQIRADSTIGMPEYGDPYFGELKGVVFCAEEAVLPKEFVERVLDFEDGGQSAFLNGKSARTICLLPVSNKKTKEKANSWIPIFNNDRKTDDMWSSFETTFKNHESFKNADGNASIVRFGSLLGGSTDGPPNLRDYGLDEGMYKVRILYSTQPKLFDCCCCHYRRNLGVVELFLEVESMLCNTNNSMPSVRSLSRPLSILSLLLSFFGFPPLHGLFSKPLPTQHNQYKTTTL